MKDNALIVGELRRRAAEGMTAVEIASWLRDELGPEATFFMFAGCLFRAFEIPVREIRTLEAWRGLGSNGWTSDEELEQILLPLVPRMKPVGE